jgi:hypothetical protein
MLLVTRPDAPSTFTKGRTANALKKERDRIKKDINDGNKSEISKPSGAAYVALGSASLRRSHVRPCHTSERDLGALFVSLNALIGHRSQPWRLRRPACHADTGCGAGFRRLSGGWTIASSGDWGLGNPAVHHIARAPQCIVPYAWTRPLIFCHAAVPIFPFGSR